MKRTAALAAAIVLHARAALGAGLEVPDNGAQALGRGGAFTAKADDPTALQYNLAGLAAQRGTHVLVDAKLTLGTFAFQRAGVYPDDPRDPTTPWGGRPFPRVVDSSHLMPAPLLAITSDLGLSDRMTFAVGAFGPSIPGPERIRSASEERRARRATTWSPTAGSWGSRPPRPPRASCPGSTSGSRCTSCTRASTSRTSPTPTFRPARARTPSITRATR